MDDPIAKAKAIAAKLAENLAGASSDLGKRKSRWDEDNGPTSSAGLGSIQKKKLYIPIHKYPDINFLGIFFILNKLLIFTKILILFCIIRYFNRS